MKDKTLINKLIKEVPSAPGIYIDKYKVIPDQIQPFKLGIRQQVRNQMDEFVIGKIDRMTRLEYNHRMICETIKTRVSQALFDPVSYSEGYAVGYKSWLQCRILHEGISNSLSPIDVELSMALREKAVKNASG